MHCGCIAAAAVACLITFSAAAPVLREDSVAAAEKPLVRSKWRVEHITDLLDFQHKARLQFFYRLSCMRFID
jgi:hypothetical protein